MINFDFLEKGLRTVSSPHFVYKFSKKMLIMLKSGFHLPKSVIQKTIISS